jgi:hypothetical protein
MKTFTVFLLTAGSLLAQDGQAVALSEGPPSLAYQTVFGYSGTNLTYRCMSPSFIQATGTAGVITPVAGIRRNQIAIAISAATNASPVVFTSTGHGFALNSRPQVIVSGGTGNWAVVNGTFTATLVDANTFSIPVNSTAFGAVTGTLIFRTTAPRLNVWEWAVELYAYDGSSNLISRTWLTGSTGTGLRCSDAALSTTNIQ